MHVSILTVILQSCLRFSLGNIELRADYGNYFDTIQNDKSYAKRDKEEEAKILSISQEYYLGTATKPTGKYDFTIIETNQMDKESSQTVGYVRKGTSLHTKGTDNGRIQNGHNKAEKQETTYEDEYSQETNVNIAKGLGTNVKTQKKKYNKDNVGPGQPIHSKKIEGINEYKRLKKIGLRSQYSPVNDNSSVLGNQSNVDSPRRGVFYSSPAVKYDQDIGFYSKATIASNSNPKGKFDALKQAFKKVGLSGKRRSYNDDLKDYFVGGEEDMIKFSEQSRANFNDPGKDKFKIPRRVEEITKPEKDELNDYQDYKGEQELRNPPEISIVSSPTTTKIRHGRAPEPSTKTTPKLLNDIESSLLGPNILRQGPSDYKDFEIGPNPDIRIVPDAGLGGGFAPRGGLGKDFMPGVPDILKNSNGRFHNAAGGFRGPLGGNEGLRAINGPTREYGPLKNLIGIGPGHGSGGFFQYRPGDSTGGGGGGQPVFQNSPRLPANTGEFSSPNEGGPTGSKPGFLGAPGKNGFSFPGGNRPDMPRGQLSAGNFGPSEMKHELPIGPNFSSGASENGLGFLRPPGKSEFSFPGGYKPVLPGSQKGDIFGTGVINSGPKSIPGFLSGTYALGGPNESRFSKSRFSGNPGGRSGPGLLGGPLDSGLNFPDGIRPPGLESVLSKFRLEGSPLGQAGSGGQYSPDGGENGGQFGPDGEGGAQFGPGDEKGQFGPGDGQFGPDGRGGGQFRPGGRGRVQDGPYGGGYVGPGDGRGDQFGPGGGSGGQFGPSIGGGIQFGPDGGSGGQFGQGIGSGVQYGPGGGDQFGPSGGRESQFETGGGGKFGLHGRGGSELEPGGEGGGPFGPDGGGYMGPGGRGGIQYGPGGSGGGKFESGSASQFLSGSRGVGDFGPGGGGNQFGFGGGAGSQFGPGGSGGSQFGPGGEGIRGGQFGPGGGGASQFGPGAEGGGRGQFRPGGRGASQYGPGVEGGGGGQFGPGGDSGSQFGPGGGVRGGGQFGPGGGGASHFRPSVEGEGGSQLGHGGGGGRQFGPGGEGGGGGQFGPGGGDASQFGPGAEGGGGGQFGSSGGGASQFGPGAEGGGGRQFGPSGGGANQFGPSDRGRGGGQFGPSGGGASQFGPSDRGRGGGQFGPSGGGASQFGPGAEGGGGRQFGPSGGGASQFGQGAEGEGGSQFVPGGGGGSQFGPGGAGKGGGQFGPGDGGGSQVGPGGEGGGEGQVAPGGGGGSQIGPGGGSGSGGQFSSDTTLIRDAVTPTTQKTTSEDPETTPKQIITESFPEEELKNMTITAKVIATTESDAVVLQKFIDEYAPLAEAPIAFKKKIKNKMTQNNEGYMSVFLISFFKMMATKNDADVKVIKNYFEPVIDGFYNEGHLFFFGEPLIRLVREYVENVGLSAVDQVKGEATLAHYAMTHRNDSLSKDLNGLINYADALYLEDEGEQIIEALYTLNQYPNHTTYDHLGRKLKPKNIHNILKDLSKAVVLGPFKRLEGSLKRKILVEALNRYVVNRFMSGEPIYIPEAERRNNFNESSSVNKMNALELLHINKTTLERKERRRMNRKGNTFLIEDTVHDSSKFDKQISQRTESDNRKMFPKYDNYWQRDSNKQFSVYSELPQIYEKYISKSNKHKYDNTTKHTRNLYHKYEYLMDIQKKKKLRNNYSKLNYYNEYGKNQQKNYDRERKLSEKDTIDNDQYLLEENKRINKRNGTKNKVIESKRFRLVGNKNNQKVKPEEATVENKFNGKPYVSKMYFAKVAQINKEFRHTTLFKNIKFQSENDIKYYKRITRSPSAKIILFKPRPPGRKISSKYKHYLKKQRKPKKDKIIKQITELTSYSSEEDELKWNLRGASFHRNQKLMNPSRAKFITNHRSNKKMDINLSSSGTDEEHILKSNIHKYFGLYDKIQ